MILSSRGKHQTTLHSTLRSRTLKLSLCLLGLYSLLGFFSTPAIFGEEPTSSVKQTDENDPLERLRRRSAMERWKTLSDGWTNRKGSPTKSDASSGPQLVPAEVSPKLEPVQTTLQPTFPTQSRKPEAQPVSKEESGIYYRTASRLKQTEPSVVGEDAYKIKKVTEINPFSDYEPDPDLAANDPCHNLCPKPGDCSEGDEFKVCPQIEPLTDKEYTSRSIPPAHYAWEAPNLYYNPLYFEDVQLERYGHTYWEPIQPLVSVGKFGVQLIGLPYQMAIDSPNKKIYPLGYYRPGECAPKLHYQVPWNTKAAAVQAGATAGAILLVP
ncbi:MAG: hypothetical protein KDA65_03140 [Planctomycetaceae bacterium]|nr:hypothetical protein [Planctomycetaceae bacterium]